MKKLRSSISSSLKRDMLFRGTCFACIGMALLIYCGLFFSPDLLEKWGGGVFFLGVGLIAWGLVPYRRLGRLELSPHEIVWDNDDYLIFYWRGKRTFSLPWTSIQEIFHQEVTKNCYGIGIHLKPALLEKILVHDSSFDMHYFQERAIKKYKCDLFLPYFSKRSFDILLDAGLQDIVQTEDS